jgi:dihydroorotase
MRTAASIVEVLPIANVTIDAKGTELTEMIDLTHAGAVAFCDGKNPVWHAGVIVKALQYLQPLDGLLIQNPEDTSLTKYGQMNEGRTSTLLGLKGIPKVAEEMTVQRDIELLKYAGGKIHFSRISSARSIEIIRAARKKGFNVTCDVTALHLAFDDSVMTSFDTNLKVNPPLRNKEDIDALIKGLLDGTIDAIVSDHTPWDEEAKKLEFDQAAFGAISLETAFAVINTYAGKKLELATIIEKITSSPRQILNLAPLTIEVGAPANLTLFDPTKEWVYEEKDIKSKSKNSPFIGKKLKGKAIAIFNKGLAQFCS